MTAAADLAALLGDGTRAQFCTARQGRHRYVQLASPEIAQLIEDLAGHAPPTCAPASSRTAGS